MSQFLMPVLAFFAVLAYQNCSPSPYDPELDTEREKKVLCEGCIGLSDRQSFSIEAHSGYTLPAFAYSYSLAMNIAEGTAHILFDGTNIDNSRASCEKRFFLNDEEKQKMKDIIWDLSYRNVPNNMIIADLNSDFISFGPPPPPEGMAAATVQTIVHLKNTRVANPQNVLNEDPTEFYTASRMIVLRQDLSTCPSNFTKLFEPSF